jgi:hypothetical protein
MIQFARGLSRFQRNNSLEITKNVMGLSWWLFSTESTPCRGHCDHAYAIENDNTWQCSCGSWEIVYEVPTIVGSRENKPWGDAWYDDEEMPRLRMLSVEQRAAERRLLMQRLEAAQVEDHLRKVESLYCDRSGQLKQEKMQLKRCKWDNHPAENGYPAGCAAHHKGKCPWVHKDQPQLLSQMGSAPVRPAALTPSTGRDFSALRNNKGRQ